LASLFNERPVRHDVAMLGEISLRGLVLPVCGIKDKVWRHSAPAYVPCSSPCGTWRI
jgi:ATP-dependent Lon protease